MDPIRHGVCWFLPSGFCFCQVLKCHNFYYKTDPSDYLLQLNLGCGSFINICEPNLTDCIEAGIEECNKLPNCRAIRVPTDPANMHKISYCSKIKVIAKMPSWWFTEILLKK